MQLSFLFPSTKDIYDARNFIVHDGNRDIFDFVTSSLLLNDNIYLLTGLKGSGKTYRERTRTKRCIREEQRKWRIKSF